jgi:RNA polymerase sigma-70 factor (ECF subfamily)
MNLDKLHFAALRGYASRNASRASTRLREIQPVASVAMVYSYPRGTAEISLQFHSFDAEYVEKLCAGDISTQEHFVAYFSELLRIKLRSRLQSKQAIEDVCQETFARVFAVLRKDGGLHQPERLGAFVNTTCNYVLFEQYRSSRRSEELFDLPATGVDSLEIVAARQVKAKVMEILLSLSSRDRSLLKAVFLEERDRDEVCREFGVDREYLRVMLHRAKQEFKTEYLKRIVKLATKETERWSG